MNAWQRLAYLWPGNRRAIERDMQEEMQALEEIAGRRELGNLTLAAEDARAAWGWTWLESILADVRYGVRVLLKSPGFACAAVLSLALGIGANTAVFSIVYNVLLRPLPYPDPDRIVRVGEYSTLSDISIPEYEFWKANTPSFASAAGERGISSMNLTYGDKQQWTRATIVTMDFFRTLGIQPALGREFNSDETRPGGPRAIVLTDGLWRRFFSADAGVIGRTVSAGGLSYTIVGVLPANFWYAEASDAFVPLRASGSASDRGANTSVLARLKPGVRLQQARAEMAALTERYRSANPESTGKSYRGLNAVPYQDYLVGDIRLKLWSLFAAVVLLLLIACSNLASLLLARLESRQKEIAVRLALGSGSRRLIRQFVIENLLTGFAGGAIGLAGAYWLLDGLLALIPFQLPVSAPIRLDIPMLLFALAAGLATSLVFSIAPLLTSSQIDVNETLKSTAKSSGTAPALRRTRGLLVVSEVALSAMLLVSAGLLIESLYRLHQEKLGFNPEGVITFSTPATPQRKANFAALRIFESAVQERLRALPGVQNAAAVSVLPLTDKNNFPAQLENHPEKSIGGMEIRFVTPGYFETMETPVLRGRTITSADNASGPLVTLVNETVVRKWWPNGNPIGDRVVVGLYQGKAFIEIKNPEREVVGIVADTRSVYLKEEPRPTMYIPIAQAPWYDYSMSWVVRANLLPGIGEQLRQAVAQVDPQQRIDTLRTMRQIVASTTTDSRFDAWLFGLLAALAMVLSAIGVFGLLSYSVVRRTAEIGTRMALGASRRSVFRLVLGQGIALVAIGLVIGLGGALAITRSLASLLYGVRPTDPVSFGIVAGLLLIVGIVAGYLPARRAMKIDPLVALRYE